MRAAVLAVSTVLVAIATAVACGGGVSTVDPLNGRDKPTSGTDNPPSSTDPAGPGYEAPPPGYEAPPTEGNPANQAGSQACIPCTGTYLCTSPEASGSATLSLKLENGKCEVSGAVGMQSVPYVPACGVDISSSIMADGVDVTVSRAGGGGFKVCVVIDASTPICATCLPTTESAGSGSGSGESSGTTVSIGVPPVSSSSAGGGCSALAACCGQLSSLDQPSCTDTVKVGNSQACSDALMGFTEENLCQ